MMTEPGVIPYSNIIASGAVDLSQVIPLTSVSSRTILVTGGASGLGAAICTSLASLGANIIVGDLNTSLGENLIAELRSSSGSDKHHFIHLDVIEWNSQVAFFQKAKSLSLHGGIDCVIANAGIADEVESEKFENPPDYTTLTQPPAPPLKTLRVNLDGVMYTATLALSYLSRNPTSSACSLTPSGDSRDRHLILVSSIAGLAPLPTQSIYCTSKHGVVGLFRALRITAPISHGVRVNMINPYFVDTPILGSLGPIALAGGAMAKIEDVIEAVTRLVADKRIIGRALMIGARGTKPQNEQAGLTSVSENQAIWDVFAHDFEQSDIFTRRVIAVTNLVANARGWTEFCSDLVWTFLRPFKRFLGR